MAHRPHHQCDEPTPVYLVHSQPLERPLVGRAPMQHQPRLLPLPMQLPAQLPPSAYLQQHQPPSKSTALLPQVQGQRVQLLLAARVPLPLAVAGQNRRAHRSWQLLTY